MTLRIIIAVFVVCLGAAACGDDDSTTTEFTDPGTRFTLSVGEEFTVVLESNATTGYTWTLEQELDPAVLQLLDDVYVEPDSDLVGAAGHQELTFRAVGNGSTFVQLWYIRPFDDPPEPDDHAQYEVIVGTGVPDDAVEPSDVDEPVGPTPDDENAMDLIELISTAPAGPVTVRTILFDDGDGLVMCEVLAESFPPQCMGEAVPISNPEAVDADFTQQDEIRWTDRVTILVGTYADGVFTVTES